VRRARDMRGRLPTVRHRTVKLFNSTTIPLLSKALDAYSLRHRAISSNIANISSAGYRAQEVSFEDQLAASRSAGGVTVAVTDPRHIATAADNPADVTPSVHDVPLPPGTAGGATGATTAEANASGVNNVDIDSEMAELARNQIRFRFAARLLAGTFKDIQESIRGSQ